ncbi:hypothetical protein [Streptomyces sp. NPDC058955]|uniref:hypothetical protein n=1 Tax=unclassified Streptomyces TaxID=2593676 RepID=UPI003653F1CC
MGEDIIWAENAWASADESPEIREEGDRVVFRGRLSHDEGGGAVLDVGGSVILFDVADPPLPNAVEGAWVEVRVAPGNVTVWPYEI